MKITHTIVIAAALMRVAHADLPSIEELKRELDENPKDTTALYNAGLSTYLAKDYQASVGYFQRLLKLEPADWQARAKLIQALSAAGKLKERDACIEALRKERASAMHPELSKSSYFIRDQFVVGEIRALAIEYYDLDGERPLVWRFTIRKGDKDAGFYYSLGSYNVTTEAMRATGEIRADERAYHLDGYWKDGTHRTYGIFRKQPTYDDTKALVEKILRGETKAVSATVPDPPRTNKSEH